MALRIPVLAYQELANSGWYIVTMLPFGNLAYSGYVFAKCYVCLMGVLECVFKGPGKKCSNMASPANLAIISRTASKFCAYSRAIQPEIFFLDLKSYENTWTIGPRPECQLELFAGSPTNHIP